MRKALEILPDAGETYIIGACRQRNTFVQRQRIRDTINTVDPVSRALRRSICITRVNYSSAKLIMVREVLQRLTVFPEKFLFCFFIFLFSRSALMALANFLNFISKNLVLHYWFLHNAPRL